MSSLKSDIDMLCRYAYKGVGCDGPMRSAMRRAESNVRLGIFRLEGIEQAWLRSRSRGHDECPYWVAAVVGIGMFICGVFIGVGEIL